MRLGLVGELDLAASTALAHELTRCIAATGQPTVVVDLGGLQFVDVCGARALLDACAVLSEHGCEVTMTRAGACVDRVLELTRTANRVALAD